MEDKKQSSPASKFDGKPRSVPNGGVSDKRITSGGTLKVHYRQVVLNSDMVVKPVVSSQFEIDEFKNFVVTKTYQEALVKGDYMFRCEWTDNVLSEPRFSVSVFNGERMERVSDPSFELFGELRKKYRDLDVFLERDLSEKQTFTLPFSVIPVHEYHNVAFKLRAYDTFLKRFNITMMEEHRNLVVVTPTRFLNFKARPLDDTFYAEHPESLSEVYITDGDNATPDLLFMGDDFTTFDRSKIDEAKRFLVRISRTDKDMWIDIRFVKSYPKRDPNAHRNTKSDHTAKRKFNKGPKKPHVNGNKKAVNA